MGTWCWPKAGPIGGAGLALPASIANFIIALIFLNDYLILFF